MRLWLLIPATACRLQRLLGFFRKFEVWRGSVWLEEEEEEEEEDDDDDDDDDDDCGLR